MDNLTDFDNTKDVSDAAIEWVLRETGSPGWTPESVRKDARLGIGYPADCARLLAARLIQRHHPELLVDPVDAIVREELERACTETGNHLSAAQYRLGGGLGDPLFIAAKRLYLMGIEKGKAG